MNVEELLTLCREIAEEAHAGVHDKGGAPYIGHPVRVAGRLATTQERFFALLHDVIEDTSHTPESLIDRGVPQDILRSVLVVSRLVSRTSYQDFVRSIRDSGDPVAIAVKRADIADNLDEQRLSKLDAEEAQRLRGKYENTLAILDGND